MKKVYVLFNEYEYDGRSAPLKAFSTREKAESFIEDNWELRVDGFFIGDNTMIEEIDLDE